ncbi:phospholipase D-like domain-containing protein [Nonomuraea sp. KM88]|uniref:phospholipase D-like domain-containing protein n=1 Tax=Nonomuraea sp. KM88 TaxID=3457427 RepID=UPI003FCE6C6A
MLSRDIMAAAIALPLLWPGTAGAQTARQAPLGAVFNNPGTADASKIVDQLITLIGGAAAGSDIRMTAFEFTDSDVLAALKAAHARGVNVKVLADGGAKDSDQFKELATALGGDTSRPSWASHCRHDGNSSTACIGDVPGDDGSKMHNKFYLFSSTLGSSDVVMQSSANLKKGGSGTGQWNSSYTLSDKAVYDAYLAYFDDLVEMELIPDYYETHPPVETPAMKLYYAPREDGDTMYNILGHVTCKGNTEGGTTGDHRTIIRVSTWHIARTAVARRLWELDQQGCYVDIVYRHAGKAALEALLKPPNGYHGPEIRTFADAPGTHQKDLLIDGTYNGEINQKVVFTGSMNLNPSSLRENDETMLRITDPEVHRAFKYNFWGVREAADVDVQTSKKRAARLPATVESPGERAE